MNQILIINQVITYGVSDPGSCLWHSRRFLRFILYLFQILLWTAGIVIFTGTWNSTTWRQVLNPIVVFAEKHGADAVLASRAVFLSTILSIITIPAMIALIRFLD